MIYIYFKCYISQEKMLHMEIDPTLMWQMTQRQRLCTLETTWNEQKYEHFLTVLPGSMNVMLCYTIRNLSHFFLCIAISQFGVLQPKALRHYIRVGSISICNIFLVIYNISSIYISYIYCNNFTCTLCKIVTFAVNFYQLF